MIPPILTNPIVLIVAIVMLYITIATLLIRSIRRSSNGSGSVYTHHVYTDGQDADYDYEIQSSHCDFCDRIDIIHLTTERLRELCSESNVGIGELMIRHFSHDMFFHRIRYFFDNSGNYLGERIPVDDVREMVDQIKQAEQDKSDTDDTTAYGYDLATQYPRENTDIAYAENVRLDTE